jgi:hypothetical protein
LVEAADIFEDYLVQQDLLAYYQKELSRLKQLPPEQKDKKMDFALPLTLLGTTAAVLGATVPPIGLAFGALVLGIGLMSRGK